MEPSADLSDDTRLTRIEAILRANKLHEGNCPKQQALEDYNSMFGSLGNALGLQCDCWLSLDNPVTDPSKALGIYHIADKELTQGTFFRTYYHAKEYIVYTHPEVSADTQAPNYWGKTYAIVPVELTQPTESTPNS
jgi:hypothetical protein